VTAPYPTGPIRLSLDARLASGETAQLLVAGQEASPERRHDRIEVVVPRLERYEVVRVG
jgi:hypothetical protein